MSLSHPCSPEPKGKIAAAGQAVEAKAAAQKTAAKGQAARVNSTLNRVNGPDGDFGTKTSLANTAAENLYNDIVTTNKEALKSTGVDVDSAVDRAKRLLGTRRPREQ